MSDRALTVHYSNEVPNLDEWANRLDMPLDISTLSKRYSAAHKYLREMKALLIEKYGWSECTHDNRLLFTIEAMPPHRSTSGLPKSPLMTVSLPYHLSSFFSPERRVQWQMVFHSALFQTMRHTIPPVGSLFYLLQCLVPGMLVLEKRENKPEGGQVCGVLYWPLQQLGEFC